MIEVEIDSEAWTEALPEAAAIAERAALAALGTVEGDVVVLLADDAAVQDLNARFRDKDRPTNVPVLSGRRERPSASGRRGAGLRLLRG
jgi:probable rRNA maturation factor